MPSEARVISKLYSNNIYPCDVYLSQPLDLIEIFNPILDPSSRRTSINEGVYPVHPDEVGFILVASFCKSSIHQTRPANNLLVDPS